MPVTITLRPISVLTAGAATTVPSGSLSAVTSDNNDATYIRMLAADYAEVGANWALLLDVTTIGSSFGRHAIRGRIRMRGDTGTIFENIDLGRGSNYRIVTSKFFVDSDNVGDYITFWHNQPAFGLDETTLNDLTIGGGWPRDPDGATEIRTMELYLDIDVRERPAFSPQVQDDEGNDASGGTITDTVQPDLFFGAVGYDELPPLDWSVTVRSGTTTVFTATGSGVPPEIVPVTGTLEDGSYTAEFVVRSTIRGRDAFARTTTISFDIENIVPPPSPPLMTVTEQDGGYLVEWTNPGGQPWDDDYVVTELWRDDCTGSQRIATIPDGLNGSYFDLAIPQLDVLPDEDCDPVPEVCDITYRIRYWGYVSTTVEVPDSIPDNFILAWPGTAGTIPSGWSRVTSLDTYYPRGANGTGAPSATGGAASHSHAAPTHTHQIGAHAHDLGGSTGLTTSEVNTTFVQSGGYAVPRTAHNHSVPAHTGSHDRETSAQTTPGTSSVNNTPPTREVIWIQSNGGQVAFPVGVIGFSTESVSGWTTDTASSGRYLRGAPAAGNGGSTYGSATHTHTINAHQHGGFTHDHTIGSTGTSAALASARGASGASSPNFLPVHSHPLRVESAISGFLNSAGGGTTGSGTLEPPHRRLRAIRNTGGGIQTRVIGLWTGTIAGLPSSLKRCDGTNGTPDMRTWFVREAGGSSINSTGGVATHSHTTPNHLHTMPPHSHDVTVLPSTTRSYQRSGSSPTGETPETTHTHSIANTDPVSPAVTGGGAGTTTSVSHLPTYREVHFVRLDGVVAGGPLPAPELRISEFSSITVPGFVYGDGMDRLATTTEKMAIGADRSHVFPRLVSDSTPLTGGTHTVHTALGGEDMSLVITVEGKPAIDQLEAMLAQDRVYWSPLGGDPGWYAPAGWTTANPAPNVWTVSIVMTRQPWPSTPDPQESL